MFQNPLSTRPYKSHFDNHWSRWPGNGGSIPSTSRQFLTNATKTALGPTTTALWAQWASCPMVPHLSHPSKAATVLRWPLTSTEYQIKWMLYHHLSRYLHGMMLNSISTTSPHYTCVFWIRYFQSYGRYMDVYIIFHMFWSIS